MSAFRPFVLAALLGTGLAMGPPAIAQAAPRRLADPAPLPEWTTASGATLGLDGRLVRQGVGALARSTGARLQAAAGTGARANAPIDTDGRWSELGPPGRIAGAAVYDSRRQRLILFGGAAGFDVDNFKYSNDTWVLDLRGPSTWRRLEVAGPLPEPRAVSSMVYDAAQDRIVVFGGFHVVLDGPQIEFRYLDDTWALSLGGTPTWTRLAADAPGPSPCTGAALALDAAHNRVLCHGGFFYDDLNQDPAYMGVYFAETWSLPLVDGAHWQLLPTVPDGPGPRGFAFGVVDGAADQLVLYGGEGSGAELYSIDYFNDVRTLGLGATGAWSLVDPGSDAPSARQSASMAFDAARRRLVLFGGVPIGEPIGLASDTWTFDLGGTPHWTELPSAKDAIEPRQDAQCIVDADRANFLVVGGWGRAGSALADTQVRPLAAPGDWSELNPPGSPPRYRFDTSYGFDPVARAVVVFGGGYFDFDNFPYGTMFPMYDEVHAWSVDDGSWRRLDPAGPGPSRRSRAASAFDEASRTLWVIGGDSEEGPNYDDAWALDLAGSPAWRAAGVTGPRPSARDGASAIVDPVGQRVVLFGGDLGSETDEVWALATAPGGAWTRLSVQGTTPHRRDALAVYDSRRHRMMVLGGTFDAATANDVWALSLGDAPAWSQVLPTGDAPSPRDGARAVYDATADRVLVFGGIAWGDLNVSDRGVYELALGDTPHWRRLAPEGPETPARANHVLVFDAAHNRMLATGGWDGFVWHGESWALSFAPPVLEIAIDVRPGSASDAVPARGPSPLPVALLSAADFDPAQVDVASLRLDGAPAWYHGIGAGRARDWNGDGTPDLLVNFDGAALAGRGEAASVTLTGQLLDGTPIEGTARVHWRPGSVALTGAGPARFELGVVRTNPGPARAGAARFQLSFPAAGAWRLEFYDVRGRRVAGAAGVSDGAGRTTVDVPSSTTLAPGLYFARLTHGGNEARARFAWGP